MTNDWTLEYTGISSLVTSTLILLQLRSEVQLYEMRCVESSQVQQKRDYVWDVG
jgi:hypothetical protein